MIGCLTIGTNDLVRATVFYEGLLSNIGATRVFQADDLTAWEFGKGITFFTATKPFDENEASAGIGCDGCIIGRESRSY